MRRPLVAGNWKMHGIRASVDELVLEILKLEISPSVDVAVLPTALHVERVVSIIGGTQVAVGAQNCAHEAWQGALTGEVSAAQLADVGCRMVLVGHSERRQLFGESDQVISRKFISAQSCGLTPILCVGETLEQRQAGRTLDVVAEQLGSVIHELGISAFAQAVIAYEPVWAIGTGLTATPEQAQAVHAAIRAQLASESERIGSGIRLLYGGSVKAANAAELFEMPDIDGGLVGGASLNADEFGAIVRAAGSK
jgi:triosephosphate isomerase